MRRFSTALVGVVALGLLLACGDSDSEDEALQTQPQATTPTQPTVGGTVIKQWSAPPDMAIDPSKRYFADVHTSKGDITFELFPQETPVTVNNFVFLAREGFYDGVKFHRIVEGFMAQGGDPTGTGGGGPGYRFDDEPVTRDYLRGTLAMANAGRNTNGSQFFIIHQDYPLPKSYTIFGLASQGLEVVDSIAGTPVTLNRNSGENSSPLEDVVIESIEIREE